MMAEAVVAPTPDSVPRRRLDARIRNFRGKTLVAVGGAAFELTETARFIWTSIDAVATVKDIVRLLAAEYDIDEAVALEDVTEFLHTLAGSGLLEY
jgi:Coenzyme PQQ synthesis protein D (PqqD)